MATRRAAEKDYLAIAKKKVHRPADLTPTPKFLVYGRNKKGKTTFGISSGIEQTLVIDPEKGTDMIKKKNPYVWRVETWTDLQDVWGALRTGELSPHILGQGKSKEPFSWVCLDGCTKLNNMALRYIMSIEEERNLDRKPGLVDRRDYGKSGELMKELINRFLNLPMGVVFTAQERMMTGDSGDSDEDDESTFFVPDLPAGVRGALNSVVDVIGRIYVVRMDTKSGGTKPQRRLQIGVHERYDTGYRSDYELPDVVKLPTIPKIINLMTTGSAK